MHGSHGYPSAEREAIDWRSPVVESEELSNCKHFFDNTLAGAHELQDSQSKLEQAIALAIAANRAKDTFLANMSHELRTPLNAILGFSQLMLKDPGLDSQHRSRAQSIYRSGEHLLGLIDQVLDLSKVENGRAELNIESVDIEGFASEAASLFRQQAAEKSIQFRVSTPPGLNAYKTDPAKLRQILFNLLNNAIKFTPENGKVDFSVAIGPSSIRFTIEDNGPGIAETDQAKIFQAFYQGNHRDRTGAGLGLCISKKLVELLGGTLSLESNEGRGSKFWLDLPVSPEEPSSAERPEPLTLPKPRLINYSGKRKRILVVDDDFDSRSVLTGFLISVGFEVAESAGGLEGLELMHKEAQSGHSFDAVLLDLHMPGLGGIATLVRLQAAAAEQTINQVPICIAVSASVFDTDRKAAAAAGFDGFLSKPIRDDQLYKILGSALNINWIHDVALEESAECASCQDDQPVTLAGINQLIDFARTGDIVQLTVHLQELSARSADYALLKRELNVAIESYQMSKIRTTLELWRNRLSQE
jgi:signal transduction histidine kinase/CheY-like chemotaxis protein